MTQTDLNDLLNYAVVNNLMGQPFQKVYTMWMKDMQDLYEDYLADQYLSAPEEYYAEQAV